MLIERKKEERSGLIHGLLRFDNPKLADWTWPCIELHGQAPGPRLCIMAGIHVNEVSSIEAAIRLGAWFAPEALRGRVSILPIANRPALYRWTEYNCPIDEKNISWLFPGNPSGSFSEALADALLSEWARDAEVLVDLHGGDLREEVSKFVMYQRSGDAAIDARNQALARCFDADMVVALEPELLCGPGRSCTGRAAQGRLGVMSEGGTGGVIDQVSLTYHMDGVIAIARHLGMIEGPATTATRENLLVERYIWIEAPIDGLFYARVPVAARVSKGQVIGEMRDLYGKTIATISAPASGLILFRVTHPLVPAGHHVLGIGVPAKACATVDPPQVASTSPSVQSQ